MNEEKAKRKTAHTKWPWNPQKRNSAWIRIKKPWPKPIKKEDVSSEVWVIMNWQTFWKEKITHKKNIEEWVKENTPLNTLQACREYGMSTATFYNHLNTFPELKEKYGKLKENRREIIRDVGETNIQKAVLWELDLSDKERVDISFRMLEKTDKAYNPKVEIETKSISINLSKSTDDLKSELQELLWVKKKQENE